MNEKSNALDSSILQDGGIEGVLFDIDDTLVDLRSAAIDAFLVMVRDMLEGVTAEQKRNVAQDFADDGAAPTTLESSI